MSETNQTAIDKFKAFKTTDNTKIRAGYSNTNFITNGASNHTTAERELFDFYATPPLATRELCKLETFCKDILEPCCGMGHISKVLEDFGYNVESSDLIDRGFGTPNKDFLKLEGPIDKDIVTNPPYVLATKFVQHALDIITTGHKVAMLLKLTFLEGQKRKILFDKYPPKTIYVSRSRIGCAKNGKFLQTKTGDLNMPSAVCFCWFVWEKGFSGNPEIRWFN